MRDSWTSVTFCDFTRRVQPTCAIIGSGPFCMASSTVSVSLEPHLALVLRPLLPILPQELSGALAAEIDLAEIRYDLLTQISRWARSDAGQARLRVAQLNPRNYDNMVSLLAGTRTSPSSKPPPGVPHGSESAELRVRRELNDRKALVAVMNGLLSVGCAGGAVWWAANSLGWRDEWVKCSGINVLIALSLTSIMPSESTPGPHGRNYCRCFRDGSISHMAIPLVCS